MRKVLILASLLLLAISSVTTAQSAPIALVDDFSDLFKLQTRIQAVVKKVRPAVVGIRISRSSGSGCFISAPTAQIGLIVQVLADCRI